MRLGKPCIKGTSISLSEVLRMLSADMSKEDILASISFANKKEETTKYVFAE